MGTTPAATPLPAQRAVRAEGTYVTPIAVERARHLPTDPAATPIRWPADDLVVLDSAEAQDEWLVVDLGRLAMGIVEIDVDSVDGASLRASYAQFRAHLGPDGDGLGTPFGTDAHPWSRVDVFDPVPGAATYTSPGKRELRYLAIALDGPGSARLRSVRVRQTIRPVAYDSHFACSDELLNRAWDHSAYGGELATVSEAGSPWMLTTPFDRVLFMGDLHMQALAGYSQSSDYAWLVRHSLERFGCVQNPDGSLPAASSHLVTPVPGDPGPPDGWRVPEEGPDPVDALGRAGPHSLHRDLRIDSFTAFWVAALADHYLFTGDTEFAAPMLPVARRAIEFLRNRTDDDGLYVEPPDRRTDPGADIPWVANWSPGDRATGIDSLSNAVYIDALRGLAVLEEEIAGDPATARRLRDRAEDVRRALLALLWDPEAGAMILNASDPRRDHTGDAVAGSLVFGVLDEDRARRSVAFLDRALTTPYGVRSSEHGDNPYRADDIQGYINTLAALGRVRGGDGAGAVELVRTWWGHMLENGPGTGWFAWATDGTVDRGSFAYTPWTTAIPALTEGVLGIRPLAAGYRRWQVAPQPADLRWADGAVPTPAGPLSVRWRTTGPGFELRVNGPAGTEGVVQLPAPAASGRVTLDGHVVWDQGAGEPGPAPGPGEPGPTPGAGEPGPTPGAGEPGPTPGTTEEQDGAIRVHVSPGPHVLLAVGAPSTVASSLVSRASSSRARPGILNS